MTRAGDIGYLALVLVPLVGAFALAPGLAAVALPQLLLNLLASFGATTDPRSHYLAPILPCLFAAVAVGLGRLSRAGRTRGAIVVLTASAVAGAMLGPWSASSIGMPVWWRVHDSASEVGVRDAAVALVPDGAPATASNTIGSHLAARRFLASVPTIGDAEWAVVDVNDAWRPLQWGGEEDPGAVRSFVERLRADAAWREVFTEDGILVFRKVSR
jgi:hypothetical protein